MKKFLIYIAFFLLVTTIIVNAQVTLRLPEMVVNEGDEIKVPLLISGFNNIGALSIAIEYNTSVLIYEGVSGQSDSFLVNADSGTIYIAFADLLPFISDSDTLLIINFKHIRGNSNLNFTGESETADINTFVLPAVYTSGKITDSQFQTSALGDRVWIDENRNGLQDAGESGLQWVTVELFSCNGAWLSYALTDSAGRFSFGELYEGDYYLQFRLADDNSKYTFTSRHSGPDTLIDSDAEPLNDSTARTSCIHVTGGTNVFSYDAGVYIPLSNTVTDYFLAQNYPNPFNPSTTISFVLPRKEFVSVTVFNVLGEKVKVLLNEEKDQGTHLVEFNAAGLRSGVYFYRLSTPSKMLSGKMVLER